MTSMGVDVYIRTDDIKFDEKYGGEISLDRRIKAVISGSAIRMSTLCEVLRLDFKFLLVENYTDLENGQGEEGYLDYVEYLIENAKSDKEKKAIKEEANEEIKRMRKNYDISKEKDWAIIKSTKKTLNHLLDIRDKIPIMLSNIDMSETGKSYFLIEEEGVLPFLKDMEVVLGFINFADNHGKEKFAFYWL